MQEVKVDQWTNWHSSFPPPDPIMNLKNLSSFRVRRTEGKVLSQTSNTSWRGVQQFVSFLRRWEHSHVPNPSFKAWNFRWRLEMNKSNGFRIHNTNRFFFLTSFPLANTFFDPRANKLSNGLNLMVQLQMASRESYSQKKRNTTFYISCPWIFSLAFW
jgi:hypothetical protein